MSDNSTAKQGSRKAAARPDKPYDDFPLYAHPLGYWSKKVKGVIRHYGRWGRVVNGVLTPLPYEAGWQQALTLYKAQLDDHKLGRESRVKMIDGKITDTSAGLTVKELCNRFLTAKKHHLDAKEITVSTFGEYKRTTDRLVATLGGNRLVDDLAADDFERLRADISKAWGPVRLGNEIQRVRTVFKYGYESGFITQPVRFGPQFKKPSKSVLRKHRVERGKRMFERDEILKMLGAAGPQLKAMILLAVNCGMGNHDCGTLRKSALDLDGGWLNYPRPKTGVDRRAALWPETIAGIKGALEHRGTPKNTADADLVFITKYGQGWAKDATTITHETGKLLQELGIHRRGLSFYALRHTFRTVADATRDFPAVRLVMGHADGSIDDVYREGIDDARLIAVAEHVRQWLFGTGSGGDDESQVDEGADDYNADDDAGPDEGDGPVTLRLFTTDDETTEGGAA